MSVGASDMLRALGSGVRGEAAPRPGGAGPIEGESFATLLDRARSGAVSTGRPVEIDPGVEIELSGSELAAIGDAVDRAEAAGASRALVLLGDRALEVDVLTRRVVGERHLSGGAAATGVDAVVRAGGPQGGVEASTASLLRLAGRAENEGVRRALAGPGF